MKSFIESQFAYCPLVWMCCDKTSDNRINHLHERALKTVYNDKIFSTFEKRLGKDNSVTIHVRSLRILATELYKTKENLAALIMHEIFEQRNIQYNLYSQTYFQLGSVKTVNSGLRGLRSFCLKIWNKLSLNIKNSEALEQFNMKIISWKPTHCSCNQCQPFFHWLGYI